jgi:hypothetical protein
MSNIFVGNPAKNPPPAAWTKISATDLFLADVKLPDAPAGVRAKKNRNIGLSVFHRYFNCSHGSLINISLVGLCPCLVQLLHEWLRSTNMYV